MTVNQPAELPIPSLASEDTMTKFLASLPEGFHARFPDSIRHLEFLAGEQQDQMVQWDRYLRVDDLLSRAVRAIDVGNPVSVAAILPMLASDVRVEAVAAQKSLDELVAFVIAFEKGPENIPIPHEIVGELPDINGLPELVEIFHEAALKDAEKTKTSLPEPGEDAFSYAIMRLRQDLETAQALGKWNKAGRIEGYMDVDDPSDQRGLYPGGRQGSHRSFPPCLG